MLKKFNKMKRIFLILILLAGCLLATGQDNAKQMLSAAVYEEEVNGNLEKAMEMYESVIAGYPDERAVVAEALYRNGLANEKLGTKKAKEYYEKVVSGYADQPEMVKLAQARLNKILNLEQSVSNSWLERTKKEGEGIYVVNFYDKGSNLADLSVGLELVHASLSPDGKKLAGIDISIGQNVALYDLQSKQTSLFTNFKWTDEHTAITTVPLWSPDGKEIAYAYADENGYNIKVSTLDGNTRTLINNDTFKKQILPRQWSKDGNNLLIFQQDSSGFFSIGLLASKGGSIKRLHKTNWNWNRTREFGAVPRGDASLSPDGKFIVYADGPVESLDLFIMDINDGVPVLISKHPDSEFSPLWSPDGKYIVFIRESENNAMLYAWEMSDGKPSGQPTLLKEGMQNVNLRDWNNYGITYGIHLRLHDIYTLSLNAESCNPEGKPEPLQYSPTGSNIIPAWSNDGKYLAFVTYGKEYRLVLLPADGSEPSQYTIDAPGIWEFRFYDLNWLPDNSGISFSVRSPEEVNMVYRFNLASEKWQSFALPDNTGMFIAWGPDINTLIYSGNGTSSQSQGLFKYNIISKESELVYSPGPEKEMSMLQYKRFSRDYKKLFCSMYSEAGKENLLLDLETGENKIIDKQHGQGTFSPDGEKIFVANFAEFTILSDKGEILGRFPINNYFSKGTMINSMDWSPDGKKLIINTLNEAYHTLLMRNVLK